MIYENSPHVFRSIEDIKKRLRGFGREIKYDLTLKKHIQTLSGHFRDYLNHKSAYPQNALTELAPLSHRVGAFLLIMEKNFGCRIKGRLRSIM